jgi:MFS transporter, FHS family, L-fucose permease
MASRSTPAAAPSAPNYTVPFIIVTGLFLIFGFLTNLNSNLSPKLEDIFHLSHAWSNLVTSAWFFAYLIFSVPASKVIEKVGYKRTMVISLFVMVVGALLFVPAAAMISFPFFLTASFVLATGVCGLQTSANPYVSILGPGKQCSGAAHAGAGIQFAGHGHGPDRGGRIHPDRSCKGEKPGSHRAHGAGPYIAIACALLALGFIIMGMHLPAITGTRDFRPAKDAPGAGRTQHLDLPAHGAGHDRHLPLCRSRDCAGRQCHQVL